MQTKQPVAEGLEKLQLATEKVHVPQFSAEDVEKKRSRKFVEGKGEIPNDKLAAALDLWVQYKGWLNPDNLPEGAITAIDSGWIAFDISQVAYRWGYMKRMLPPEQWKPGWGRRPRRKPEHEQATPQGGPPLPGWNTSSLNERFRRLDERINVLGRLPLVEDWLTDQGLQEKLQYIIQRSGAWDDVAGDFKRHQKEATPSTQLSSQVTLMDQEIVRLAGIVDLLRTARVDLLEKVVKIENKLRGGGRKGPSRLTKLHREIRRRIKILLLGGK